MPQTQLNKGGSPKPRWSISSLFSTFTVYLRGRYFKDQMWRLYFVGDRVMSKRDGILLLISWVTRKSSHQHQTLLGLEGKVFSYSQVRLPAWGSGSFAERMRNEGFTDRNVFWCMKIYAMSLCFMKWNQCGSDLMVFALLCFLIAAKSTSN